MISAGSGGLLAVSVSIPHPARAWMHGLRERILHLATPLVVIGGGSLLGAGLVYELRTSALQAYMFSQLASLLTYEVAAGPSDQLPRPGVGPFDAQRGYSRLPEFQSRLRRNGFRVTRQARVSPVLAALTEMGIAPPYRERGSVGLRVRDRDGAIVYDRLADRPLFDSFEDIPPLIVRALLFMENRQLLDPFDPRSNPSLEWDRMTKASFLYGGSKLGLPLTVEGGSTLAVQLEKFRHSPGGRTRTPVDKLRQIVGASLKSYRDGIDTGRVRREIVLDYLNTMPLAAAPRFGEVHGLGEGLYAWFGLGLGEVRQTLTSPGARVEKARAFKHVLALLAALRAPTFYLLHSRSALEVRVDAYVRFLAGEGILDKELAAAVRAIPIELLPRAPQSEPQGSFVDRKAVNAIRTRLMSLLGVTSFYDLDRLDLAVESTVDTPLQTEGSTLLQRLSNAEFVAAHGLAQERMLLASDPQKVLYSLMLFERTEGGNLLRVQADSLDQPFDINTGTKMELGSTAKLRTLAHYLELVEALHRDFALLTADALERRRHSARDPITEWAARTLSAEPGASLEDFLQKALDRRYSASPGEAFFTGGGRHTFGNFDPDDNSRILSVREGMRNSVNLVFIRLMGDLVRFHRARLPYDADAVLDDPHHPVRGQMLQEIADSEARLFLRRAYQRHRGHSGDEIIGRLLGRRKESIRHLAIFYFAWHGQPSEEGLATWLRERLGSISLDELRRLMRAYGNPWLGISDYGYLLSKHPLDVWCAGELIRNPALSWDEVLDRSREAREISSRWLFKTGNRRAQDIRLRIRIEQDAFARMTPYWKRLGFPFKQLVPTLATAIGNSGDRPAALAELMAIIVNDGIRRPMLRLTKIHFGEATPYETVFEPDQSVEPVVEPAVARALRGVLADVVEAGTGRRMAGAFVRPDGTRVVVGGKTGSGDNRYETFNRYGGTTSSRTINRTATFVFYIGERYFGVLTAHVPGRDAAKYSFTSALPVSVLKLLAPAIGERL